MAYENLINEDQELYTLIESEEHRQREQLEMIPSENYVSLAVREAVGSPLMNKYSEGQAFKRYYQGNEFIDYIEDLTKKRALGVFNLDPELWGVNVQAVTGSVANLSVYNALLQPGDTIMSMFLYDGGHLSHGWKLPNGKPVSMTSKVYHPVYYYVDPQTRWFNYDEVEKIALEHKPKIIISGGTAYPREIDYKRMKEIADKVGALYMADVAHEAGLIAGGANKSPFPYADIVTMTTRKTLRGPIGAMIFAKKEYIEAINSSVFPGLQGGPMNHSIAGIAVALKQAAQPEFKEYTKQIVENAQSLAQELVDRGYDVCTGGTDKHLVLIDLRNLDITGTDAAVALEKANIIVNKNTVPNDSAKPWNPSGIRIGTPAITSRGIKKDEMTKIANWMHLAIMNREDEKMLEELKTQVRDFALTYPVPGLDS
ncbi:serine hydroxymethyltransferase [candidate division WWE3 bacterium]|nr:serine hydroxymethyltransferase [candidate division WWE3 bacterium]